MNHNNSVTEDNASLVKTELEVDDPLRRETLRKLGSFAAYTAPTLLLLLSPRSGHSGSIVDVPPTGPSF
ncbi:MAG: hypothetical protein WAX77_04765 [Methylococcaceae bacterium]